MAQEKARATRTRKPTEAGEPARKPVARSRKKRGVTEPTPDVIAFHAYLLWEHGEPGSPDEHWLRAEQELIAA